MLIDCLTVVALYLMSQWVGSSELATPTQQHRAKKVSFVSIHDPTVIVAPFQMMSRLQSTVGTERCPICQTCILSTRPLADGGVRVTMTLDLSLTAIPFTSYSRERCTNGHSWGELGHCIVSHAANGGSGLQSDAVTHCYWQPAHCAVGVAAVGRWLITCCPFRPLVVRYTCDHTPDDDVILNARRVMVSTAAGFKETVYFL